MALRVGRGILRGVAFAKVTPEQIQALQALLLFKGEMRQAGVRLPLELAVTCQLKGRTGTTFSGTDGQSEPVRALAPASP
jgi:hypothetical protein